MRVFKNRIFQRWAEKEGWMMSGSEWQWQRSNVV